MMMTFCKKSVHSFLGLASSMDSTTEKLPCKCQGVSALAGGLGLITATGDIHRSLNVVESSTIKSTPPSSPPSMSPRKDPGGFGFIDDIGGGVDGLMSCTESLGFESSDERRFDDEIVLCSRTRSTGMVKWRKMGDKREIKKFPPPLSSLNHNGQPSFFLRPIRKDGRLELTEVRIDRPEILRAYRQDGRLRLHLIRNDCFNVNEVEEEHELEESHEEQEQGQEMEQEEEEEVEEEIEEEKEEEKEEESVEEWRFPVTGEGFRRCYELMSHHHDYHHHHINHHHNLHVWSQHCVISR